RAAERRIPAGTGRPGRAGGGGPARPTRRERALPGPPRPRAGRGGGGGGAGTGGGMAPAPGPGWRRAPGPSGLRPVDQCVPGQPEMPGGMRADLLDHLDLRVDPATSGWFVGRPGGRLEMRGWVRFADGRAADPLALLQMVDALPPTSFELGLASWAPTVELTVYL